MDTAKVKQLIDRLADHLDVETNSYAEDLIESLRKEVLPAPVNANPEQPQVGDKPGEYVCPHCGTARICDYCTGLNRRLSERQPGEFGEPWVFSRTFEILVDSRGLLITQIHNGFGGEMICDHQACGDGRVQMRRIVACVNACRGIPTEELEAVPAYADLKIVGTNNDLPNLQPRVSDRRAGGDA